jgi:hypothetical protein
MPGSTRRRPRRDSRRSPGRPHGGGVVRRESGHTGGPARPGRAGRSRPGRPRPPQRAEPGPLPRPGRGTPPRGAPRPPRACPRRPAGGCRAARSRQGRHLYYGWASDEGHFTTFTEAELEQYGITSHLVVGPSLFALPGGIRRLEETALDRAAQGLLRPVLRSFPLAHASVMSLVMV